jgi:hypothetical protein
MTFNHIRISNVVVNHNTYRRGLTLQGTIACVKKLSEAIKPRERVEIKINMGRITNPSNNFPAGSRVPTLALSDKEYVVSYSPDELKQPAISSSLRKGSPKLIIRLSQKEFGMT